MEIVRLTYHSLPQIVVGNAQMRGLICYHIYVGWSKYPINVTFIFPMSLSIHSEDI